MLLTQKLPVVTKYLVPVLVSLLQDPDPKQSVRQLKNKIGWHGDVFGSIDDNLCVKNWKSLYELLSSKRDRKSPYQYYTRQKYFLWYEFVSLVKIGLLDSKTIVANSFDLYNKTYVTNNRMVFITEIILSRNKILFPPRIKQLQQQPSLYNLSSTPVLISLLQR